MLQSRLNGGKSQLKNYFNRTGSTLMTKQNESIRASTAFQTISTAPGTRTGTMTRAQTSAMVNSGYAPDIVGEKKIT